MTDLHADLTCTVPETNADLNDPIMNTRWMLHLTGLHVLQVTLQKPRFTELPWTKKAQYWRSMA